MIDAKEAVLIAKQAATGMLEQSAFGVEEIERETYKDRDVWSITLSFTRNVEYLRKLSSPLESIVRSGVDPLQYKRCLIDVETGELVAIKLRELATR